MDKAVNDATLTKLGDIYQYYIALLDCFELKDGQTLQIEVNGDVSIISNSGEGFQKEVKHHLTEKYLTDRDIDFWKTVANWYEDYERIEDFSEYILSTTAIVKNDSSFYQWNKKNEKDKLACLKMIGQDTKSREETFRKQYDRIFTEKYDENRLLKILNKFNIVSGKTKISGISQEFSKYIRPIPKENRDGYIDAL